ncbi:DUF3530 family protein [Endozoicomonas sp. G2_1]|uniref:DUF3530 family protein n=1 Tax=Endozoicomonas sp. G2_1 TaxID=2821091 RepID=UPI001ADB0BAE|nr:DUF3530 family protein [Endozoicomonas sp. G2_1]MBO9491096.1 DUF3530 family protein [Endozoicomonas sp. G2_1]
MSKSVYSSSFIIILLSVAFIIIGLPLFAYAQDEQQAMSEKAMAEKNMQDKSMESNMEKGMDKNMDKEMMMSDTDAESKEMMDANNIRFPVAVDQQHQSDLKHYQEQVDSILVGTEEISLLNEASQSANSKGTVILLPDWQLSATNAKSMEFLRTKLPELGWATIAIQPFAMPSGYPSSALTASQRQQENQTVVSDYLDRLSMMLEKVMEQARQNPGIILLISEGTHAALLTDLLHQQRNELPNALILMSSYQLDNSQQQHFAEQLAQLDVATLDLVLAQDHPLATQSADLRKRFANTELKLDYRQQHLFNISTSYYPEQDLLKAILGWLKVNGW